MLDWQRPSHSPPPTPPVCRPENLRLSDLPTSAAAACPLRCLGDSHATVQCLNKRVYLIQLSPQGRAKWASALCDRDNERAGWGEGGEWGVEGAGRGRWWVVAGPVKRRPPFKRSYFNSFSAAAWDFGVKVSTWLISFQWEDSAFRHRRSNGLGWRGKKKTGRLGVTRSRRAAL